MYIAQKLYINNRPLILTNSSAAYRADNPMAKGYDLLIGAFPRHFRIAKQQLDHYSTPGVIIEDIDVDSMQDELKSYFKEIEAGGGVVRNPSGEVLMIFRRGKWDLPKGKIDKEETIEDCAIREIKEETGLPEVALGKVLGITQHIYTEKKKDFLKTTRWFEMTVEDDYVLSPQVEENILEAKWIDPKKLSSYTKLTYEGVKDVLRMANLL